MNALQILKRFSGTRRAGGGGDGNVCLTGRSRRSEQRDALDREWVGGVQTKGRRYRGDILDFFHGRRGPADFHADLRGIGAEAISVNLYRVTAYASSGVGENLQNLRTVAERVRRKRQPGVLKIRGQIDCA